MPVDPSIDFAQIKIGAKVVGHAGYVAFQMAEVAVPKTLFAELLQMIAELRSAAGRINGVKPFGCRVSD